MAPALSTISGKGIGQPGSMDVNTASHPPVPHGLEELRKMRHFMTGLRKYVEQNAEYVGSKFPDVARKIHYGETAERPIYGEASLEQATELVEEGIDVAPLPPDPKKSN